MNRERLPALGCGLAVALQLAGGDRGTIVEVALWTFALWGIRALTDERVPKFVLAAPAVSWLLPTAVDFFFASGSAPHLSPAAVAIGGLVMAAAFAVTVIAAAPKVGWGLSGLSFGGIVCSVAAHSLDRKLVLGQLNVDVVKSLHAFYDVLGAAGSLGIALVPAVWIALAVSPFQIAEFPSRKLAILGAIGAGMAHGLLEHLGQREHGKDFEWRAVVLFSIGWLLLLLGTFGVARANKSGLAWGGFALCIVQVLACPGMAAGLNASNINIVVAMAMAFGMLGLAFVAFSRDLPLRPFRLVAGGLLALAAFGSFATNVGVMCDLWSIVHIKGDPASWWTAQVGFWSAHWGLKVWCLTFAMLGAPPTSATPIPAAT